jgi:flavin reductase (DIM6/NTAB) family NADH-FMN oxidoreductase RutF
LKHREPASTGQLAATVDRRTSALIALDDHPVKQNTLTINHQNLRRVMGHFATGVTVVTTRDKEGAFFGLTANAFTSLSLDPPLVLICVDRTVQCYSCFEESKLFAVNILSEEQEGISRRFATKGIEKFAGLNWRIGDNGLALLDDAVGHIECRIVQSHEGGDHTIMVGEVLSAGAGGDRPLLFFKGKYCRLPPD